MATDEPADGDSWKIEPKDGAEVYLTQSGKIAVKQEYMGGDAVLLFHRDEIPDLIECLQRAHDASLESEARAAEQIEQ